jgi:hypothetical protein
LEIDVAERKVGENGDENGGKKGEENGGKEELEIGDGGLGGWRTLQLQYIQGDDWYLGGCGRKM